VKHHALHRFLRCYYSLADIGREIRIGKVRTSRDLAALMTRSSIFAVGLPIKTPPGSGA
jgi:hypothetical protein